MKKSYETPIFYLEEFALNQAIAKSCGDSTNPRIDSTQGDYTSCGIAIDTSGSGSIDVKDTFLFLKSTNLCEIYKLYDATGDIQGVIAGTTLTDVLDADTSFEEYCYHNPTNGNKLFGS